MTNNSNRLRVGMKVRNTVSGGTGTVAEDGYVGNVYGQQVLVRSDATGRMWGWYVDECEVLS